jgi:chromodomain-helicase-DNA-binding protein 1
MPPASSLTSAEPLTNGHLSPLPSHTVAADLPSSYADSDLSDAQPPSPPDSSSTSIESEPETQDEDAKDVNTPMSGSDEDAEGDDDDDFDLDVPQHALPVPPRIERSSTPGQGRKRKYEPELEEEIKKHPELYATRRSVSIRRAIAWRPIADLPIRTATLRDVLS